MLKISKYKYSIRLWSWHTDTTHCSNRTRFSGFAIRVQRLALERGNTTVGKAVSESKRIRDVRALFGSCSDRRTLCMRGDAAVRSTALYNRCNAYERRIPPRNNTLSRGGRSHTHPSAHVAGRVGQSEPPPGHLITPPLCRRADAAVTRHPLSHCLRAQPTRSDKSAVAVAVHTAGIRTGCRHGASCYGSGPGGLRDVFSSSITFFFCVFSSFSFPAPVYRTKVLHRNCDAL